jgi:hypothetical protein
MDDIDCKKLVADLAVQFYDQGWFPGSGGSLTIRKGKKRQRGGGGVNYIVDSSSQNFFHTTNCSKLDYHPTAIFFTALRKLLAVQTSKRFYLHVSDNC